MGNLGARDGINVSERECEEIWKKSKPTLTLILIIVIGIFIYDIYEEGFNSYQYDLVAREEFPTKWYNIEIVKKWEEDFEDEYGHGTYIYTKRPFKNYTLEAEKIDFERFNKRFAVFYSKINGVIGVANVKKSKKN